MALPLEQKNLATYLSELESKIANRTNINLFDKDSKTGVLVNVFSEQLYNERQNVINAFNALNLSTAKGSQIDEIGAIKGIARLGETFASADKAELCFAFYVESGTFGDINSAADIIIPKGTRIWSDEAQNDLGKTIYYITTSEIRCLAGSSIAYGSIKAEASGSGSNVGSSVLRNHDFINYANKSGLLVINFFSILNGRNRESDDQYKYRISQFYATVASSNETKAKLLALNIPGVLDTKVINGYFGIGTVGLILLGSEYQTNNTLINLVQNQINRIALPGVTIKVLAAVSALFDLKMTIVSRDELSNEAKSRVENTIRRVSTNYLRSKGLGGNIDFSELAQLLIQYLPNGIRLRSSGISVFDSIVIRRNYLTVKSVQAETLLNINYNLEDDEYADLGVLSVTYEEL